MSSSRAPFQVTPPRPSTEIAQSGFSDSICAVVTAGDLNDARKIRNILCEAIKRCGKSRAEIADLMSVSTDTVVTEQMINGFTAESRADRRFPSEMERAFCAATGDYTLLHFRIRSAGLRVIGKEEQKLLELGQHYLTQRRAAAAIRNLEAQFAEGDL